MLKHLRGLLLAFLLLLPLPAFATDFLYDTGTNGFTKTPFNLMTTELGNGTGLASGNTVVSSVNGGSSNGIFTQTDTGGAIWCEIAFVSGGAFTPTNANAALNGWFIRKADNTNFEKLVSNTAPPRAPDFIIPLYTSAYAANDLSPAQGGRVLLPAESFKVLIQQNSGAANLASSGNVLTCGPFAVTTR